MNDDRIICPYCGQITTMIWVHGHGQCAICKTNIDECCRGEQGPVAGPPKTDVPLDDNTDPTK